jgi:hypothetical protein
VRQGKEIHEERISRRQCADGNKIETPVEKPGRVQKQLKWGTWESYCENIFPATTNAGLLFHHTLQKDIEIICIATFEAGFRKKITAKKS